MTLHYEDDDFADPWREHETFVLVHGFAESSQSWFAWVPHLARRYRVLRPDLRGFGGSSVPPAADSYAWSAAGFAREIVALLDRLELSRVHLVGARVGSAVAMQLAADCPERVRSLSLISGLVRGGDVRGLAAGRELVSLDSFAERIRGEGLAAWFSQTSRSRLGEDADQGQVEFWSRLMADSDESACIGLMRAAAHLDITEALGRISAPTCVIASAESRVQDIEATRRWQQMIAGSRLLIIPGDSPHLAATMPDRCAAEVLAFVQQLDEEATGPSMAAPGLD